jgi:hypothetical protein
LTLALVALTFLTPHAALAGTRIGQSFTVQITVLAQARPAAPLKPVQVINELLRLNQPLTPAMLATIRTDTPAPTIRFVPAQ